MMFKRYLKYIPAAAILCYLFFAFVIIPSQKDNDKCKDFIMTISGNRLGTINSDEVLDMLKENGLYPKGKTMDSISCLEIEDFIKTMSLVKECQVYKTNDKKIMMDLVCREPILKVFDKNGATYYVDYEGNRINDIKKPLLLPVASGHIDDSMLRTDIKNFVKALRNDPFWIAQIEQIYFDDKRDAIITPRMGDHIIELGSTRELDEKLSSIKTFYAKGLNVVGWNKYSKLNVKVSNKVICTKREK